MTQQLDKTVVCVAPVQAKYATAQTSKSSLIQSYSKFPVEVGVLLDYGYNSTFISIIIQIQILHLCLQHHVITII